jgi:arsenate reductase
MVFNMNVLILCTGNSCRSQMAHGILQALDKKLEVHSGGTNPAARVHPKAVQVMSELGLDISDHTPHHVDQYLDRPWDYVITVCGGANEHCPAFLGTVHHRLHIGFEDPAEVTGTEEAILDAFRHIRDQILSGFFAFYNLHLRNN